MSELTIDVRPRDDKGRHLVIAKHSGSVHKHRFDVDSQFHRKQFREAVIGRFNLDDDEHTHTWLEAEIVAKAAAAESSGNATLFAPVITLLDTVAPQKVEWLWPNRIAVGKNNLLVGDPGLGKSLATLDIAAHVSRGAPFPDSPDVEHEPGGVVILTLEDDPDDTLVPRLIAHDADRSRIAHVEGVKEIDGDGKTIYGIDLLRDIQAVRAAIEQVKNCKLLIVDTISDYMGEKSDAHKNRDTRAVLNPLAALANECRIANWLVSHGRKAEGRAVHAAIGSVAFVAQSRVAWLVTRCPTNPRRRLMTCIKNNLADDTSGLAFSIEPYGPDDGPVLCWEAEPVHMSAEQAMAQSRKQPGRKPDERDDAATWLVEQLANGPKTAGELQEEAEQLGFNVRTLRERSSSDSAGSQRRPAWAAAGSGRCPPKRTKRTLKRTRTTPQKYCPLVPFVEDL